MDTERTDSDGPPLLIDIVGGDGTLSPFFCDTRSSHPTISGVTDALYYGDNLDVLAGMPSASVDLIYLDPPFNSQRNYNLVFRDKSTSGQKRAFVDVWNWDDKAERAYRDLTSPSYGAPAPLREIIKALHDFFGPDRRDDMAYPAMMAIRLLEMHRILKDTGTLYLHCDPTASHYLRLILDAIFGEDRFLNEVVWRRATAKNDPNRYGRCHDTILVYARGKTFTWNQEYTPFQDYSVEKNYTAVEEGTGRRFRLSDLTANKPGGDTDYEWHGQRPYKGRHWAFSREKMDEMLAAGRIVFRRTGMPVYKRYLDEMPGVPVTDVWTDISLLASASPERIGYPTQKPVALLKRIIEASSNPGDVVLDPFCGCGTSFEAAREAGRVWNGIDISVAAVEVIRERMDRVMPGTHYLEYGFPADIEGAQRLAATNPHSFQWWVLAKVRGRQIASGRGRRPDKKGGDRGVDGEILVRDIDDGRLLRVIVSVKAGANLNPSMLRDLVGTVAAERADMGLLLTMAPPTEGMRKAAREHGTIPSSLHPNGCPRFQIITVEDIFAGKHPLLPGRNVTQDSAPTSATAQPTLPGIAEVDRPATLSRPTRAVPSRPARELVKGARKPALRKDVSPAERSGGRGQGSKG